jgi:hypothetical protein
MKTNMNVIKTGELMIIGVLFSSSDVLVGCEVIVVPGVGPVDELVVADVGPVDELVVADVGPVDKLVVADGGPVDELVVEDVEFRYAVRDSNAFKADASPISKGSKICATFS